MWRRGCRGGVTFSLHLQIQSVPGLWRHLDTRRYIHHPALSHLNSLVISIHTSLSRRTSSVHVIPILTEFQRHRYQPTHTTFGSKIWDRQDFHEILGEENLKTIVSVILGRYFPASVFQSCKTIR